MNKFLVALKVEHNADGFIADALLPGFCCGTGKSFIECIEDAHDAVVSHISSMIKDGEDIPTPAYKDGYVYIYVEPDPTAIQEVDTVSAAEAARILGVTPPRVSHLIKAGKLLAFRNESGTLIVKSSLDEYLNTPRSVGRPRKNDSD